MPKLCPIHENVPLAPLTTLGIGGPARFFAEVRGEGDLVEALAFAEGRQLPIFILGGGSNVLVADEGFPGLVIRSTDAVFYFLNTRHKSSIIQFISVYVNI